MADKKQVKILKQGLGAWHRWQKDNPDIRPNLSAANLSYTDLSDAKFRRANLVHANLSGANLSGTDLIGADLRGARLKGVNLMNANLMNANLADANLYHANLRGADLRDTNLRDADLRDTNLISANLNHADLSRSNLSRADLRSANFEEAICSYTIFVDVDLSTTKGLDTVHHESRSHLEVDTIFRSRGKIPEIFLKGCGAPETLITFLPSMMEEAIVFYSCFISYSHDDKEFAKRLYDRLQGLGIRCWLDEHQLKPGDELHKTIYEGIRVYDKVILCCSETALKSWWVEKEFKNAITKEEDYTETVLIPITLDDYLFKQSKDNWTIGEINRRFVQDFSGWKNHDAFESAFKKVVDALRTDGGKPPPPTPKLTRR